MSDPQTTSPPSGGWLPVLRSRWWTVLLIASLAVNLLIGAAVVAHFVRGERMERMSGGSYTQLIPRKFFADLPRERRRELLDTLKQFRGEFRNNREEARNAALKLADALDAEPYDAARTVAVAAEFANTGNMMAKRGSDIAVDFVAKLSPEERKMLAQRIRDRAKPRGRN